MTNTSELVYETLKNLTSQAPELHAQIRQKLYDHLAISLTKQSILYAQVLAPASSGKLESQEHIDNAHNLANQILSI
ncbi:PAS factor family protein [Vibrio aestuarianus]|uniref:PAS factor family protein n=1 Tax=Vibrio aestuarianus TaxID=28171 RepID=UPI00237CA557|nr:PAS factor family protein [Vibrio aestuarianus]MDE1266149.1 secretion protein [Vibrio aestuarianus]MDE1298350.1 secretion protein [Vibrio aestuarianus]